jgi:hypothetical protein
VPAIGLAPAPLPGYLRLANGVAALVGADSRVFRPERIFADAARHAGLPARFPAYVEEAVEVLCRSLRDEVDLHWFGRENSRTLLVTGLSMLLQVEDAFVQDKTLAQQPLVPPLVVTGLPRSGTTFLHRMLAAEPDAASITMTEHVFPLPHRPVDYRRLDVWAKFQPWLAASNRYNMDAMHYVRPDLPDECNFGMRLAGRSMIYWATAPVHGYLRWLLAQDLRECYQLYRKVLLLHQRRMPGRRITLKCPQHLAWLPALAEALPEALIVQTHRDPMETVPSECKLVLSLQAISARTFDWQRSVEGNSLKVRTYAERSLAFADTPAGSRVKHVDYRGLVRDPLGVVRDVHAHFGLPFTASHETALARFASANRQHKHGRNDYSAEQYGLDRSQLAVEFKRYRERFLRDDMLG